MSGGDSTERGARGVRSLAPWGVVCEGGRAVRNEELGPHTLPVAYLGIRRPERVRVKRAANKSFVSLLESYHHMKYAALNVRSANRSHPGCRTYASPEGRWRISRWRYSHAWWQWAGLWWPTRFSEQFLFAPSGPLPF